jgi:hypothetical protein
MRAPQALGVQKSKRLIAIAPYATSSRAHFVKNQTKIQKQMKENQTKMQEQINENETKIQEIQRKSNYS